MAGLSLSTKFYPIRVLAHMRNEAELNIIIENKGGEPFWVETDVILPSNVLSLAPDKELLNGRLRAGIIFPKESRSVRCKVYAGGQTYADTYNIGVIAYAYNREGAINSRE
jgi:uncharacterized membrane protein